MLQESWDKINQSKNIEILRKDAAEMTCEEEECGTSILTARIKFFGEEEFFAFTNSIEDETTDERLSYSGWHAFGD